MNRHLPERVWLTGATSGIGLAVLEQLARQGVQVVATGRNHEVLEQLTSRFPEHVTALAGDLTDPGDVSRMAQSLAQMGPIDWAILNAGTCEYMDVREFDAEMVARVMDINVVGAARATQAVLPVLRETVRQGRRPILAYVSSSAWWFPFTRAEAYGASKAALTYFARSLRADLASEGIAVSLIEPGFVKTPLTDQNDFEMPFLITSGAAAEIMIRSLVRGRRQIHFPKRFTLSLKLLRLLPESLIDRMAAAISRNQASSGNK